MIFLVKVCGGYKLFSLGLTTLQRSQVFDAIKNVTGVSNVHDLHIWSISHGQSCLSVHAAAEDIESAESKMGRREETVLQCS